VIYKRYLEFNGERKTIDAWARELKIPAETLRLRIKRGWPVGRALLMPVRKYEGEPWGVDA